MEQVLELEVTDDITSIRSRIDFILSNLVRRSAQLPEPPGQIKLLLVVPGKNTALQNLVSMKLLARWIKSRAVEVAIVSSNPTVRDYAKEVGLKTFSNLLLAKWAGWLSPQTDIASPEWTLPYKIKGKFFLPGAGKNRRTQKKKYEVVVGDKQTNFLLQVLQQATILLVIFLLAAAFVLGVVVLFPQATVTLTPVAQPVEAELIVKGDPDATTVDFKELTFPARVDQVELKIFGEIETIKTELSPVGEATGRVVFINRTEAEQIIPANTTLAASAGTPVEFTTVQTATVPPGIGATSAPTSVVALEEGPRGNVSVGQINRVVDSSYALLVRVVNEESLAGGTMSPARVVEQADKERLDAYLRQKIQQEGLLQLQEKLVEQEFIPPESVQVIVLDVKYREFAGDISDTFGGEMQAVVRATVIGGYNANRLGLAALEAQVPPGFELDLEGLSFGAGEVLDIQERVVSFKIFAKGQAVPKINDREVAEAIAWLPIGEAQSLLKQQYSLATVPGIDLKPDWLVDWLGRLPFSDIRINVVINDAVTTIAGRE